MLFGLKNAHSEFQNIMNEIFIPFSSLSIIYIDDVLIFSIAKTFLPGDNSWTAFIMNFFLKVRHKFIIPTGSSYLR